MEEIFNVIVEATTPQLEALKALGFNPIPVEVVSTEEAEVPGNDLVSPVLSDGAQEQSIEPENIDKVDLGTTLPFVKAQISTKNQMIIRNLLAVVSSIAVVIAFILEKLGIL